MISPQKCLKFSRFWLFGVLGEGAPSGSIPSQNTIVWFFEIMFFESSQHEDSNY